jgi:hypothetical protein
MDVVMAFLNPAIDNDSTFMNMPPGIDWLDSRLHKTSTVRLLKALYGLKQAPRLWWQEINDFLLAQGFVQSKADPNLYLMDEVFLLLYVDDILIFNLTANKLGDSIKTALSCRYKMTDLGRATRFLGLELEYLPDGSISICQGAYIRSSVTRYGLSNAASTTTPMDTHVSLDNCDCEDKPADESEKRTYLSMVGSLMYAAIGTRPDISYAVKALSRYNQSPLTMHLTAAKRIIRYLKGTVDLAIVYRKDPSLPADNLRLYSDSDWAGSLADRKSVGGCTVLTPGGTGLINWFAKKQSVIALSTLEAEYIACSDATREALWFRQLMEDTRIWTNKGPTTINCDNMGALQLLKIGVIKAKTKHIAVKYHHSHDESKKGTVAFQYTPSKENVADVLTKLLAGPPYLNAINLLGMEYRTDGM